MGDFDMPSSQTRSDLYGQQVVGAMINNENAITQERREQQKFEVDYDPYKLAQESLDRDIRNRHNLAVAQQTEIDNRTRAEANIIAMRNKEAETRLNTIKGDLAPQELQAQLWKNKIDEMNARSSEGLRAAQAEEARAKANTERLTGVTSANAESAYKTAQGIKSVADAFKITNEANAEAGNIVLDPNSLSRASTPETISKQSQKQQGTLGSFDPTATLTNMSNTISQILSPEQKLQARQQANAKYDEDYVLQNANKQEATKAYTNDVVNKSSQTVVESSYDIDPNTGQPNIDSARKSIYDISIAVDREPKDSTSRKVKATQLKDAIDNLGGAEYLIKNTETIQDPNKRKGELSSLYRAIINSGDTSVLPASIQDMVRVDIPPEYASKPDKTQALILDSVMDKGVADQDVTVRDILDKNKYLTAIREASSNGTVPVTITKTAERIVEGNKIPAQIVINGSGVKEPIKMDDTRDPKEQSMYMLAKKAKEQIDLQLGGQKNTQENIQMAQTPSIPVAKPPQQQQAQQSATPDAQPKSTSDPYGLFASYSKNKEVGQDEEVIRQSISEWTPKPETPNEKTDDPRITKQAELVDGKLFIQTSDGKKYITIPTSASTSVTIPAWDLGAKEKQALMTGTTESSKSNDKELARIGATYTPLRKENEKLLAGNIAGRAYLNDLDNFLNEVRGVDKNGNKIIDPETNEPVKDYSSELGLSGEIGRYLNSGGMKWLGSGDSRQQTIANTLEGLVSKGVLDATQGRSKTVDTVQEFIRATKMGVSPESTLANLAIYKEKQINNLAKAEGLYNIRSKLMEKAVPVDSINTLATNYVSDPQKSSKFIGNKENPDFNTADQYLGFDKITKKKAQVDSGQPTQSQADTSISNTMSTPDKFIGGGGDFAGGKGAQGSWEDTTEPVDHTEKVESIVKNSPNPEQAKQEVTQTLAQIDEKGAKGDLNGVLDTILGGVKSVASKLNPINLAKNILSPTGDLQTAEGIKGIPEQSPNKEWLRYTSYKATPELIKQATAVAKEGYLDLKDKLGFISQNPPNMPNEQVAQFEKKAVDELMSKYELDHPVAAGLGKAAATIMLYNASKMAIGAGVSKLAATETGIATTTAGNVLKDTVKQTINEISTPGTWTNKLITMFAKTTKDIAVGIAPEIVSGAVSEGLVENKGDLETLGKGALYGGGGFVAGEVLGKGLEFGGDLLRHYAPTSDASLILARELRKSGVVGKDLTKIQEDVANGAYNLGKLDPKSPVYDVIKKFIATPEGRTAYNSVGKELIEQTGKNADEVTGQYLGTIGKDLPSPSTKSLPLTPTKQESVTETAKKAFAQDLETPANILMQDAKIGSQKTASERLHSTVNVVSQNAVNQTQAKLDNIYSAIGEEAPSLSAIQKKTIDRLTENGFDPIENIKVFKDGIDEIQQVVSKAKSDAFTRLENSGISAEAGTMDDFIKGQTNALGKIDPAIINAKKSADRANANVTKTIQVEVPSEVPGAKSLVDKVVVDRDQIKWMMDFRTNLNDAFGGASKGDLTKPYKALDADLQRVINSTIERSGVPNKESYTALNKGWLGLSEHEANLATMKGVYEKIEKSMLNVNKATGESMPEANLRKYLVASKEDIVKAFGGGDVGENAFKGLAKNLLEVDKAHTTLASIQKNGIKSYLGKLDETLKATQDFANGKTTLGKALLNADIDTANKIVIELNKNPKTQSLAQEAVTYSLVDNMKSNLLKSKGKYLEQGDTTMASLLGLTEENAPRVEALLGKEGFRRLKEVMNFNMDAHNIESLFSTVGSVPEQISGSTIGTIAGQSTAGHVLNAAAKLGVMSGNITKSSREREIVLDALLSGKPEQPREVLKTVSNWLKVDPKSHLGAMEIDPYKLSEATDENIKTMFRLLAKWRNSSTDNTRKKVSSVTNKTYKDVLNYNKF